MIHGRDEKRCEPERGDVKQSDVKPSEKLGTLRTLQRDCSRRVWCCDVRGSMVKARWSRLEARALP